MSLVFNNSYGSLEIGGGTAEVPDRSKKGSHKKPKLQTHLAGPSNEYVGALSSYHATKTVDNVKGVQSNKVSRGSGHL